MDRLVEMLKRHEGLCLTAYRDHLGHWTIGYGCRITGPAWVHALDAGAPFGIHEVLADALLTAHINIARNTARNIYPDLGTYPEARRDVIVSLAYQLGSLRLARFVKMRQAILDSDWTQAAPELIDSQLHEQTPERVQELALMLETGEYIPY
ncbi:hypothetical protein HQ520_13675 [bacterium]|nr:hypothetical protein [bacterium]